MKMTAIKHFILIIIGFFIVNWILWNRLFRLKLPRTVPFELNDYLFLLCFYTMFIFVFLVCYTIFSFFVKTSSNTNYKFNIYNESLQELDLKFKSFDIIWEKTRQLHVKLIYYSKKFQTKIKYIYWFMHLPKIILPIILFVEIFKYQYINYFYKALPLLLLPLLFRYLYYSLDFFYNVETYNINQILEFNIVKDGVVYVINTDPSHFYFQEMGMNNLNFRELKDEFRITFTSEYKRENPDKKILAEVFDFHLKERLPICIHLFETLHLYDKMKKKYNQTINLFMLFLYAFCWTYLFFSAVYKLSDDFLEIVLFLMNNF